MSPATSEQTVNRVAELVSPGPGERLRSARLSKGYDIARMASELHLTQRIVQALEADEYDGIEARVFVRGYMRNYARTVGIPPESILRQFDERWPDESAAQATVNPAPELPADGGPVRGWSGALTWLLAIGSVVLFLLWWRGYPDGIESPPVPEIAGEPADAAADAAGPSPAPSAAPVAAAGGSLAVPGAGSAAGDGSEAGAAGPSRQAASPGADGHVAPELQAALAALPPGADPAPAAATAKEVVMAFSEACWVDVRDSERSFKLFGEMPAGAREVLGGTPPYKLVIGNARGVEILIDGAAFDLAPYSEGNVARFTLQP